MSDETGSAASALSPAAEGASALPHSSSPASSDATTPPATAASDTTAAAIDPNGDAEGLETVDPMSLPATSFDEMQLHPDLRRAIDEMWLGRCRPVCRPRRSARSCSTKISWCSRAPAPARRARSRCRSARASSTRPATRCRRSASARSRELARAAGGRRDRQDHEAPRRPGVADLRRRADGQADRRPQGGRAHGRRNARPRARPPAPRHAQPRRQAEAAGARRGRRDRSRWASSRRSPRSSVAARPTGRPCSSRRPSPRTSSASAAALHARPREDHALGGLRGRAGDRALLYYMVSGMGRVALAAEGARRGRRPDSAIIFCNTREETSTTAEFLRRVGARRRGRSSSDLTQKDRERVMGRMRGGNLHYLVATDIAARGIDISDLSHVINYTFPRVGRGVRAPHGGGPGGPASRGSRSR